jgi:hypothetical protein
MRASAPLLLVLATLLAGCIQAQDARLSAKDADAIGGPVARSWHADAVLAVAGGGEKANMTLEEGLGNLTDGAVGDGRAVAWGLAYVSPTHPDVFFGVTVLARNRSVVEAVEKQAHLEVGPPQARVTIDFRFFPAKPWAIDSDQAAWIARQNTSWARLAGKALFAGFSLLGGNGTDPVWVAGLASSEDERASPDGSAAVFIDAADGRLLPKAPDWLNDTVRTRVELNPGAGGTLDAEGGRFDGTVTIAQPQEHHRFNLDQPGHAALRLVVSSFLPAPGTMLALTLTGPDGVPQQGGVTDPGPGGKEALNVQEPLPGGYGLDVRLQAGVLMSYSVCWEAEGAAAQPGQGCGG